MIPELERNTRNCPRGVCFLFEGRTYVNAQIRLQAAGLARALQLQGVRRGSFVACDMDNSPALVLLAVAAGYGGFALVALNRRLTDAEKDERLSDLERNGYHVAARLDETTVVGMLHEVSDERTRHVLRHHAERFAAQFNLDDRAMVLFTSGTSGRANLAQLGGVCKRFERTPCRLADGCLATCAAALSHRRFPDYGPLDSGRMLLCALPPF